MTLSQIFAKLNILNAEVALCRNNYRYSETNERWACSITLDSEGTEIKVRKSGADGDEALRLAFEAFDALMSSRTVSKALNLPLLSNPSAPQVFDEQGVA